MTEAIDPKEIVARRVAREIRPGMLVNLGIGLPSLVANYLPPDAGVFFQAENGVIGLGARPPEGMEEVNLTDAGGGFVTTVPGAASIDSALSFGLIRGGHLDMTVLGGLQVDERGYLANWTVPGKMVPGMGGAMDLVTGARRVVIAMQHTARGKPKILDRCALPLTSARAVDLVVTELAVIGFPGGRATLLETAPGVTVDQVAAAAEQVDGVVDVRPAPGGGDVAVTSVVLDAAPGTGASDAALVELRERLADVPGAEAAVGGETAEAYDVAQATARDTRVVVPLVLVLVLLVARRMGLRNTTAPPVAAEASQATV